MSLPLSDDRGGLLGTMSQLHGQLQRAESDTSTRRVIGTAASGMVRVEVAGEYSFEQISIDPSVVDLGDLALLEDLLLVALRDATTQLRALRMQAMGGVVSEALSELFRAPDPGDTNLDEPHS